MTQNDKDSHPIVAEMRKFLSDVEGYRDGSMFRFKDYYRYGEGEVNLLVGCKEYIQGLFTRIRDLRADLVRSRAKCEAIRGGKACLDQEAHKFKKGEKGSIFCEMCGCVRVISIIEEKGNPKKGASNERD